MRPPADTSRWPADRSLGTITHRSAASPPSAMSKRKTTAAPNSRPKPRRVAAAAAAVRGNPLGLSSKAAPDDAGDAPTERQMEIYAFIRDKIHSRGYGPTVREIGQAFKIRSPNGVVCHLKALERKGLITRGKNMSRAIELVNEPAHLRGLPMAGWVAAGTLRAAEEQSERIDFESLFNRDNHFVLKVMGESMIDAQIADGDWVVIQKKQTAHPGDIVVAQTEDGEATLKQWFPERDRIRLQPANAAMKPIYVRNARVLGVLVGVVRKT
jgi:repressor LexA